MNENPQGQTVEVRATAILMSDTNYVIEQLETIYHDLRSIQEELLGPLSGREDGDEVSPKDTGLIGRLQERIDAGKGLIQEIQDIISVLKAM